MFPVIKGLNKEVLEAGKLLMRTPPVLCGEMALDEGLYPSGLATGSQA